MKPTHYTLYEGGDWFAWGEAEFDSAWLEQRHHRDVPMGEKMVHSLAFSDPCAGYGTFQRWDCVNGMNQ